MQFMNLNLMKNIEKSKNLIVFTFIIILLILVMIVYKNDEVVTKIDSSKINQSLERSDYLSLKKFLLKKINSPFIDIEYEIKNGDSIQKILKKLKIKGSDIQKVIEHYKKYSNPNKLLAGNKIEIVIEKNISKKDNSLLKFLAPVNKSSSIEITKNEDSIIVSQKIITKLYKRRMLAEKKVKS